MSTSTYPFIDLAVHDDIRESFAAGVPIIVLATDLNSVIWANGSGAQLLGFNDVELAKDEGPQLPVVAERQLRSISGFPHVGKDQLISLRLANGATSRITAFKASFISLPEGEAALMLTTSAPRFSGGLKSNAARIIAGIEQPGYHACCLDAEGKELAASSEFYSLSIAAEDLRQLAKDVSGEADRLVKRHVSTSLGPIPVGVAKLTDNPAVLLLIAVENIREEADDQSDDQGANSADATVLVPEDRDTEKQSALSVDQNEAAERVSASDLLDIKSSVASRPFGRRESPPAEEDSNQPVNAADMAKIESDIIADRVSVATKSDLPPIRFVWKTNADGIITEVSESFIEAIGPKTGDIVGLSFSEIAKRYDLDPHGEIGRLMERKDTWSGRQVLWPASDELELVPVDLAALPIYDRAREFKGFRGFGVARIGEKTNSSVVGPLSDQGSVEPGTSGAEDNSNPEIEAKPTAESANENIDPFVGEKPAIEIAESPNRRHSDKVIELTARRTQSAQKPEQISETEAGSLSDGEKQAFREIADRLKSETEPNKPSALAFGKKPPLRKKAQPSENDKQPIEEANEAETSAAEGETPSNNTVAGISVYEKSEADLEKTPDAGGREKPGASIKSRISNTPAAFALIKKLKGERQASQAILNGLDTPIVVYNPEGVKFTNTAFLGFVGYPDMEAFQNAGGIDSVFDDTDADHVELEIDRLDGELSVVTASGRRSPVKTKLQSIPWEGEKALMLSFDSATDLEPRQIGSESDASSLGGALNAQVDELVSILDTATDGVVTINSDGTIRSLNRSAEALFGHDSEDLKGAQFTELFATESQRSASDYLNGLSEHGVASLLNDGREVIGREAKGRFIPMFMTIGKLAGSGGFCAVLRDITHWKQAEDELLEAKRQAEQASSQKTEFLARISHEIRTPLNAIIGFSELMLDEKFGPINNERYKDYLGDINRSGNHVLDLVNDLLDISKIEAGQLELDYEAVSLNDALSETIAIIQPQANRERVIVRSSLSSGLPDVVADLRSVRQIALNLLSNAIRFTLAGGQVIVSTSYETNGCVVLRVRDTGVGMSQVELNQALKPFKQINALKRGTDKGSGLGLPLTKAMVEANRAKFAIDSTPGEGTLVVVTFPPARVLAD